MNSSTGQRKSVSPALDDELQQALDTFAAVFKELVLREANAHGDDWARQSGIPESLIVAALQVTGAAGSFPVSPERLNELLRQYVRSELTDRDRETLRGILADDTEPSGNLQKLADEHRQRKV